MTPMSVVSLAVLTVVSLSAANHAAARPLEPATVTKIEMSATPKTFTGTCPAKLRFRGVIHVSGTPATVEYQWERSDGAHGPKKKIVIKNAGVGVWDTWQLGGAGEHVNVWEKLHVLSPNDLLSESAGARVACK